MQGEMSRTRDRGVIYLVFLTFERVLIQRVQAFTLLPLYKADCKFTLRLFLLAMFE